MRAALFRGPGSIEVGDRPDPVIQTPTDAIVRVTLACVCGSDLWYDRGESDHAVGSIGHEFVGVVEDVETRGDDAYQAVLELTDGLGVDAALECVGTDQSMTTAFQVVRPGGGMGLVGDVLAGLIDPGRVFDYETDVEGIPDAYAAMDDRRAIKSLIGVSANKGPRP
jgi:threonine dehydrogenase-like Zn-dependent dehydrogenase